jgi:hypothetical protein
MPSPGVYAQVIDRSFSNGLQSRFACGLVGVAARGPLDEAVRVRSLADFVSNFGPRVEGSFLATAVGAITAVGDGTHVVRVGTAYGATSAVGSGASGGYYLFTSSTAAVDVGDYLKITQTGKLSTPNARVQSISTGTITLVSSGAEAVALADTYTAASVSKSEVANALSKAESQLTAPTYNPVLTLAGTALGNKSEFTFTVSGDPTQLQVGDVIKLVQTDRATTREAEIQAINNSTKVVTLIPITNTETGRQAVPLQDNYTTASIYVLATDDGQLAAQLNASTEGTWANTVGQSTGLQLTVAPGTKADTKKLLVYLDGALVETQDNLSYDSDSDDYWVTRLANDAYINVANLFGPEPPGNTLNPWNSTYDTVNVATFAGGFNGENVTASDYVGTVNPTTESATGLLVYNDKAQFGQLYALAVPGVSDAAVMMALAQVAATLNAVGYVDVPDNINGREAIDWGNGEGVYANRPAPNNYRLALFWNWTQLLDVFSGETVFAPPTASTLALTSQTFDRFKPWYAAAGEQRGALPGVTAVRYPRVREDLRTALAEDSVLVPILLNRGSGITVWGNKTTQRASSFLQELSVVHLVNYLVKNLSALSSKYVFDPNDGVLLSQLSLDGTTFLNTVVAERGVERYFWQCNEQNNTAAVRNARAAIIDLGIIPIGAVEVIKLNLTVNAAGAVLNQISQGVTR